MIKLTNILNQFALEFVACEQGKGKERRQGRGKEGACRNGQCFPFPNAGNLCHVQINYLGRKHNDNSLFLIDYTATKLG